MHRFQVRHFLQLLLLANLLFASAVTAETVRVAVAANFFPVMKTLSSSFEQEYGHEVELVVGSSGKLAAQIIQGAPFDLFLSADSDRPEQLEKRGMIIEDSRKTYAKGRLVLLIRYLENTSETDPDQLQTRSYDLDRIAIANPQLAPYGRAAKQSMDSMGFLLEGKQLVYGENISQTFHFFVTGHVDVAFVALSQMIESGHYEGMYTLVNEKHYRPIDQQMVLISDKSAAAELHKYILFAAAQSEISRSGYHSVSTLVND